MTDESLNLLPCPFCGGTDATRIRKTKDGQRVVVCDASTRNLLNGCGGSCGYQLSRAEAIAAWNRRTPQPDKAGVGGFCEMDWTPATIHEKKWICRVCGKVLFRNSADGHPHTKCPEITPPPPGAGEGFDDWPEFHAQGMGCGLEDRGITDRYEAMRYGWDEALDAVAERIKNHETATPTLPAAAQEDGRDAARYRWLRDAAHDWDIYYPTDKNASGIGAWLGCTDKDAAIDAAMLTSPDSGKEG